MTKNQDMWTMLLSTIRYSMGRQTYMVGLAPELVIKYHKHLTDQQIEQVADEIDREIKMHEKLGKTLGSDFDHQSWKESSAKIRDLIKI